MRDPIVRMYEAEQQARDAVQKLKDEGFPEDQIFLVTPRSGNTAEAIAAAIMAGFVLRSHARIYAEGIQRGRSLVVVRASFGHSQDAIDILNGFGPVDTGLRLPKEPSIAWDEAAPLSSAFRLPVLIRNSPAPMSRTFGMPPLSKGRTGWLTALFGELTKPDYAFSSVFGMSLLSRNPAPLSSLFGLKTVTSSSGPWKTSFGLPLLIGSRSR
ncbi:MAG: general stress protein [Steroidobacteraceae bacterium]|nr:general stress protein [Steroidobacteraceae bacterium]